MRIAHTDLPGNDVRFLSSASPLHGARLFQWEGEFYRAIRPAHTDLFRKLLREGVLEDLAAKGLLISSEEAPLQMEGYGLILKHPRIPCVTYPFEWPAQALRDAALQHVRLNLELARYELICQDAHPRNIVFDGTNPVFVDLGSIVPLSATNPDGAMAEFNGRFYYPLRLMERGQRHLARCLLSDLTHWITDREFTAISGWRSPFGALRALQRMGQRLKRSAYKRLGRPASARDHIAVWRRAERAISSVRLHSPNGFWTDYYKNTPPLATPDTLKERTVADVLERLKPKQLLDIGCNAGRYSRLAASLGARVAACDADEGCVDQLYSDAKLRQLPLTAFLMNIRIPVPSHGWSGRQFPSAMERLRSDCVLALAVAHHLVFSQMADLEIVIDALCRFTRRDLVVEFISRDDQFVSRWWKPG
jgi:hypothetical protein